MTGTFKSFSRTEITKAFALAHRLAEHPAVADHDRVRFRQIAKLIWDAAGEQHSFPERLPEPLVKLVEDEGLAERVKTVSGPLCMACEEGDHGTVTTRLAAQVMRCACACHGANV